MAGAKDHPAKSTKNSPAIPFWMWGAVAALVLFSIYISRERVQVKKSIEATNSQMETEIAKRKALEETFALERRAAIILTNPRSVTIHMVPDRRDLPRLEAAWHTKLGLLISGQNIAMPSGNRTLQLWLIPKTPGAKPIPSITLRPDGGKFMLLVADPPQAIGATKALIITEEPAGGSQAPTTKPIWVGAIS